MRPLKLSSYTLATIIAIACLSSAAITSAQTDTPRETGGAAAAATTATATVKAIDPATRTVTLERPDGQTVVVRCGPAVRNFDQIAVGDRVRAALLDRLVVGIAKPGAVAEGERMVIARAPEGTKPGLVVSDTVQLTERIESVDPQARKIMLRDAGGKPQPYDVAPDVDLAGVKAGDEVVVRMTRGLAIVVEKPDGEGEAQLTGVQVKPGEAAAVTMVRATATVESIDADKRLVTLKAPDGKTRTVHLGEECINFDQIKVGDRVTATLAEEHAIAVGKPGTLPKEDDDGDATLMRAPAGSKPRVFMSDAEEITARIDSIDAANRTVTLTPEGGKPRTIKVGPAVKLEALKPGDEVAVRCTQALAIVVESP